MTQPQSMAIDVFWSFRSPWSYLATRRLRDWQTQYDLTVNFRPVYPIAVRTPEFFHSEKIGRASCRERVSSPV